MKVFISQPLHGKTDQEALQVQERVVKTLMERGYPDIEVVDNIHKENVPNGVGRLWYLGDSVKLMDGCDLVVFADGWNHAKGCLVEFKIAKLYNLKWEFEEMLI